MKPAEAWRVAFAVLVVAAVTLGGMLLLSECG